MSSFNQPFKSTIWTMIREAQEGESLAVNNLLDRYREPVVGFLRNRGLNKEDAEDVANGACQRLRPASLDLIMVELAMSLRNGNGKEAGGKTMKHLFTCILVTGAALTPMAAAADAVSDFYRGKTLTVVVATGAGSATVAGAAGPSPGQPARINERRSRTRRIVVAS